MGVLWCRFRGQEGNSDVPGTPMTEDDFGYATTSSAMADHEQLERTHESPLVDSAQTALHRELDIRGRKPEIEQE